MIPSIAKKEQKHTIRKLDKNSRIFKTIIRSIQDKKGEHIVSIDLRKIPEAISDYFIVCEAGSSLQIRAIADHVEEEVKKNLSEKPYEKEGFSTSKWVILDYVNIVVHIFHPETRHFYSLEDMWSDAFQEIHEA